MLYHVLICSCLLAVSCQKRNKPSLAVPKTKEVNIKQTVKPVFILVDSVKTANKMIYISFEKSPFARDTASTKPEDLSGSRLTVCSTNKSCKAYDNSLRCNSCGGWIRPTYIGKRIIGAHEVAFQGISDDNKEDIIIDFRSEPFVIGVIQKRYDLRNEKKQEGITTIYLKPKRKILLKDFVYVPDLAVLKEQFYIQQSEFKAFK